MYRNIKVEEQNQNIYVISKIMSDNDIGSVVIIYNYEKRNPVGIVTNNNIFKVLMNNKELLSTVVNGNLPIPQKQMYEEFSHSWFSNAFFK